jgi:hypothetical protein
MGAKDAKVAKDANIANVNVRTRLPQVLRTFAMT